MGMLMDALEEASVEPVTQPSAWRTRPTLPECVFCDIVAGRAPAKIVERWPSAIAFVPLNPVVDGHVLVIPKRHVANALEQPEVTAATMRCASELAYGPCNILTSVGIWATQSVFHLHIHIVPRRPNDGLKLPWTGQ